MKKKQGILLIALLISANVFSQTLNDAIRLTDNEQYESASTVFRVLISNEPSNATNYYYFGENYLFSDNADSALMMYNQGAKIDPNNLLLQIGQAKYQLNMYSVAETKRNSNIANDDYNGAKSSFDNLAVKTPEAEAKVIEMKAKATEAEALYQAALANVNKANFIIDEIIVMRDDG